MDQIQRLALLHLMVVDMVEVKQIILPQEMLVVLVVAEAMEQEEVAT
jgi:hypothetical protein